MVHSGTRVFHFFDPEDLGAGAEEYGQVIDKLRSYGITPYLDGDPSSAELELGQRWLDCLFGPGAYELRASGQRFDAAKHAVWIEGVAAEGGVPVYWGWDPSFARVVAQVVEWRWQWGGKILPSTGATPHCGGSLLGFARALRLVLDKRHELEAHREVVVSRGVDAAELWSVHAVVGETLLGAVELEAPGMVAEGGLPDGAQFPVFVIGLALSQECSDDPEVVVERYGFSGAVADAVREALDGIAERPELQQVLSNLV